MKFQLVHTNFNVFDLDKSLSFYQEALGLKEVRRIEAKDNSFIIVFLADEISGCQLELTWLKERDRPYDLGDQEFHICFRTDDFAASKRLHEKMGCISYLNEEMGLYFITDPDGYWIEIIPER